MAKNPARGSLAEVRPWANHKATLALMRRRLGLKPLVWKRAHMGLATLAVVGTAAHALLIEGTMEQVSKLLLCVIAIAVTAIRL